LIMKEAARIKEQQEKIEAAIRIAKIAVDSQATSMAERTTSSTTNENHGTEGTEQTEQNGENVYEQSETSGYLAPEEITIEGNDDDDEDI